MTTTQPTTARLLRAAAQAEANAAYWAQQTGPFARRAEDFQRQLAAQFRARAQA